jgi:hypothetical protein
MTRELKKKCVRGHTSSAKRKNSYLLPACKNISKSIVKEF